MLHQQQFEKICDEEIEKEIETEFNKLEIEIRRTFYSEEIRGQHFNNYFNFALKNNLVSRALDNSQEYFAKYNPATVTKDSLLCFFLYAQLNYLRYQKEKNQLNITLAHFFINHCLSNWDSGLNKFCYVDNMIEEINKAYNEFLFENKILQKSIATNEKTPLTYFFDRRNNKTYQAVINTKDHDGLESLPEEILELIMSYLELKGLVNLSQTNSTFNRISKSETLWRVFEKNCLTRDIAYINHCRNKVINPNFNLSAKARIRDFYARPRPEYKIEDKIEPAMIKNPQTKNILNNVFEKSLKGVPIITGLIASIIIAVLIAENNKDKSLSDQIFISIFGGVFLGAITGGAIGCVYATILLLLMGCGKVGALTTNSLVNYFRDVPLRRFRLPNDRVNPNTLFAQDYIAVPINDDRVEEDIGSKGAVNNTAMRKMDEEKQVGLRN